MLTSSVLMTSSPRRRGPILVSVLCAFLAACATTPRQHTPTGPISLETLTEWQAHGRLAVAGPAGGGSGSFEWQQRAKVSTLDIRGPVGIGSLRMTLDDSHLPPAIALESSRGKVEAGQALAELEARLGGPVPAEQLQYWILGKAAPGDHEWHDESSDNPRLEQAGWTIDYSKFSSDAGARLPTVIKAANGGTRVRLVIDRWQLDR